MASDSNSDSTIDVDENDNLRCYEPSSDSTAVDPNFSFGFFSYGNDPMFEFNARLEVEAGLQLFNAEYNYSSSEKEITTRSKILAESHGGEGWTSTDRSKPDWSIVLPTEAVYLELTNKGVEVGVGFQLPTPAATRQDLSAEVKLTAPITFKDGSIALKAAADIRVTPYFSGGASVTMEHPDVRLGYGAQRFYDNIIREIENMACAPAGCNVGP